MGRYITGWLPIFMPPPPEPTPAELAELADKYDQLVRLRAVRDTDDSASAREVLRDLSRRYPGSLRELDTLGAEELERRALAARAAAAGGAREVWMDYVLAFHRLMAAALFLKAAGREGAIDPAGASQIAGVPLPPELLAALKRPTGGRITPVVLAALGRRYGRPAREIAGVLFRTRRASPYDLG
jgi:hypothetical protein